MSDRATAIDIINACTQLTYEWNDRAFALNGEIDALREAYRLDPSEKRLLEIEAKHQEFKTLINCAAGLLKTLRRLL